MALEATTRVSMVKHAKLMMRDTLRVVARDVPGFSKLGDL